MGRFHRHADGTVHDHDDASEAHAHEHDDLGDHTGYVDTGGQRVLVLERIFAENDRVARDNRRRLHDAGVRTVNMMSAPGAGKTTLLRRTLAALSGELRIGVLEGDITTSLDADALDGLGAAVALINTSAGFGGECHLDAVMVASGLSRLPLDAVDLLVIENVGNLVCPAEFDVGEDAKAMISSITEGEDKPLKYPVMFQAADVVVINKLDLLPYLEFDLERYRRNVLAVNPDALLVELSARTGDGVAQWLGWLRGVHGNASG